MLNYPKAFIIGKISKTRVIGKSCVNIEFYYRNFIHLIDILKVHQNNIFIIKIYNIQIKLSIIKLKSIEPKFKTISNIREK
jgi:hypothetical protein